MYMGYRVLSLENNCVEKIPREEYLEGHSIFVNIALKLMTIS